MDRLAVYLSDAVTSDTELRTQALSRLRRMSAEFYSLPVGAPSWSWIEEKRRATGGVTNVLFYGNYLPLHGAATIIEAYALAIKDRSDLLLRMVGGGVMRPSIERLCVDLEIRDRVIFRDVVSTDQLAEELSRADIVLGIFGSSQKAATVIPNKVWQGIAAERTVITRQSDALREIEGIAGEWLIQIPPASPTDLAHALTRFESGGTGPADVAHELEQYVERQYLVFLDGVLDLCSGRKGC
jgi:glycosyltransferase involved in cell wall biosynthesis